MKLTEIFQVLIITGVMSLVANTVGTKNDLMQAIPGMGILIAIAFVGMWMGRVLPGKIPGVAYVVTLGCILTYPGFPGSDCRIPPTLHSDPGLCGHCDLQRPGCLRQEQLAHRPGQCSRLHRHLHRLRDYRPGDFEEYRTDLKTFLL